ncbi:phosphatidate cytidylyltransferase [Maribellus comscasis]|jgi:phosphatidate cytidylyltransferase|uniref:Phosphatidate cytidylyltransferase n=1 Tax=Maribellus comscasis TaxID=2681766 RepID=A0A6I6JYL5_9BACT|nr:phosphatidate cytidylyltransferase [Maribellus comscasis]QGY46429.1 phosphatidate cytidylyltransferase [Maribellus comscasis]
MIRTIYIIILIYFLLGGIGFYLINRKKAPELAKKSYTKYFVYFIIINILFFSITVQPFVFHFLTVLIICAGSVELTMLFFNSNNKHIPFFLTSIITFIVISLWFLLFSLLKMELTLYTFLVISIFDSFSQITGQLWGRKKILPGISPNKTLGGLTGGIIIALISAFLLKNLFTGTITELLVFATGTVVFAFAGDVLASLYKRKYKVKDYSNLIPGHGGFLDRFDSLIAGGAWSAFYFQFIAT